MVKDETGKQYKELTVIKRAKNDKHGNARWECECSCGNKTTVLGASLRKGDTGSCGCMNGGYNKRSGTVILTIIYNSYRQGAKSRGFEFNLSKEEVIALVTENCIYCGTKPARKKYAYHKTRYTKGIETDEYMLVNGIDRVNNNKGYTKENSVTCCFDCNGMKSSRDQGVFIEHITRIYKHLNKKI